MSKYYFQPSNLYSLVREIDNYTITQYSITGSATKQGSRTLKGKLLIFPLRALQFSDKMDLLTLLKIDFKVGD